MMAMQSSILASTMHSKGILDAGDAAWLKRACLGTAKGRLVLRALFARVDSEPCRPREDAERAITFQTGPTKHSA